MSFGCDADTQASGNSPLYAKAGLVESRPLLFLAKASTGQTFGPDMGAVMETLPHTRPSVRVRRACVRSCCGITSALLIISQSRHGASFDQSLGPVSRGSVLEMSSAARDESAAYRPTALCAIVDGRGRIAVSRPRTERASRPQALKCSADERLKLEIHTTSRAWRN